MKTNKAIELENEIKENANFYNETDFSVEYIDCNDYLINWEEAFIDMTDLEELEEFGRILMIEVASNGNLIISIELDDEDKEMPY